jgi:hypothetical protein
VSRLRTLRAGRDLLPQPFHREAFLDIEARGSGAFVNTDAIGHLSCADKFLRGDIASEEILHVVLHPIGSAGARVLAVARRVIEEREDEADLLGLLLAVPALAVVSLSIVVASVVAKVAHFVSGVSDAREKPIRFYGARGCEGCDVKHPPFYSQPT